MVGVPRFVSWAAVSTLPQAEKISIDDQLRVNREHIASRGGQLVAELIVPGESRSIVLFEDAARLIHAYAQLREMIDARAFDVLIFRDRSRLGRTAALSMSVIGLCQQAGIAIYETESPPSEITHTASYDDMLLGAIKSVGAESEVRRLVERHRLGMIGRARSGKMPGRANFGYVIRYDADGVQYIEIEPVAADVVRRIYQMYLAGNGTPRISDELNATGAPCPAANAWSNGSVRSILTNVWRYAGFTEINRRSKRGRPYERHPGAWPAIIDIETAEAVDAERLARSGTRRLANTPYLLSSVVWCAICGRRLIIRTKKRAGAKQAVQMCCRSDHASKCVSVRLILATLRSEMDALRNADLDAIAATETNQDRLQRQADGLQRALDNIATGIARADNAYVNGLLTIDRYAQQLSRLSIQRDATLAELSAVQAAIENERDRGTFRARLDDVVANGRAILDSRDPTSANVWLRSHLRVWVANHNVIAIEWL